MNEANRKTTALDFLRLAREGHRSAAERLLAPGGRHHNPYFAAGLPALLDGIEAAAKASANRTFDVKHVSSTFGNESNTAKIDGYTLFGAGATWQRGPLRITLSGRNLFSQEYYFDVGSTAADPGPPRQVLLSTTIRLGK